MPQDTQTSLNQSDDRRPSIAFVGAGPTTIYTLCAFLNETYTPARVTVYEEQPRAGLGTPYRPGWNDPAMLSNIASIEIPEIEQSLIDWLEDQPRARLIRLGIDPDQMDERAFYPRVALGEYFLDQFNALIARARAHDVSVEIATSCRVTDMRAEGGRMMLSVTPTNAEPFERAHDRVVLATGHQWPEESEVRPGFFASPWPATSLQRIPATLVGIRGSSLTAIDSAVAVAGAHGNFIERDGCCIDYACNPGSEDLKLVMMSRKGLLPEADFFHPIPYEPLTICTAQAIADLIESHCDELLERSYALFKAELAWADPDYAAKVDLASLALEDFADAYYADRIARDPFVWAQRNLDEARANFESETVVGWRYAILRMHEVIAEIVPHLNVEALDRFNRYWKPVFVDDYATVPHLSIERLLALHRAECLDVLALGEQYKIDAHGELPGAAVVIGREHRHFPAFIEATGQRPLAIDAFPFQTLLDQGVVRDVASEHGDEALEGNGREDREGSAPKPPNGVAVDDAFHPTSDHPAASRLYCLSIPFILGRHPFIQGITSSHEMGKVVGADLARMIAGRPDGDAVVRTGSLQDSSLQTQSAPL